MNNPDSIKAFGERLRKIRDERNMSQQELADIASINKKTIQKIEHARMNPSLDTLVSIAKALDMPLKKLMDI